MRREIMKLIWQKPDFKHSKGALSKDEWMKQILNNLQLFNENLYRAYKDQYVRLVFTCYKLNTFKLKKNLKVCSRGSFKKNNKILHTLNN